ncbi:MAG TPA: hypothetical protein PKI14_01440 [Fervidobacterium sp.]|nr:hypothetical protein [Fervidobacterium sp.]
MNNLSKISMGSITKMNIDIGVATRELLEIQLRFDLYEKIGLKKREMELRLPVTQMIVVDIKSRFV